MDKRAKAILFLCRFTNFMQAQRAVDSILTWWHKPTNVSNARSSILPYVFEESVTEAQPDDPDLEELFDIDLPLST